MTNSEIKKCWQEIDAEIKAGKVKEDRARHDNRRRGQFQAGWKAAKEENYTDRTLKLLHWNNLGYRFGKFFGPRDENEVREAYAYLATHHDGDLNRQVRRGNKAAPPHGSVRIFKIAPGEKACFWEKCRVGGYICVGWDQVGDLMKYDSIDELKPVFGQRCSYSPSWKANELWKLRELQPGDKIIANNGLTKVVGVGTVVRPGYVWMPSRKKQGCCHTVRVHWDRTSWGGRDWIAVRRQPWNNTVAPVSRELFERVSGTEMPKGSVITDKATREQRKMLMRLVSQRQGQPKFRKGLLEAYGARCAISRCGVEVALEAAHIDPKRTAVRCNGLLLRSDLHLLFDMGLLAIDPAFRVHVKPALKASEYWELHKKKIRLPRVAEWQPRRQLLEDRYRLYMSG